MKGIDFCVSDTEISSSVRFISLALFFYQKLIVYVISAIALQPMEALSYYESDDSGNDDFFHACRMSLRPGYQ